MLVFAFLAALFAPIVATLALFAASVADPANDLPGYVAALAQLWSGAQWAPLIALVVVGIVAAARRWGASVWPWLGTRTGGLVLVALTALAGSLAEALVGGAGISAQLLLNAIVAGVLAIGGHSAMKNARQGNAAKVAIPAACNASLYPSQPELVRCALDAGHAGVHRARGSNGPITWEPA